MALLAPSGPAPLSTVAVQGANAPEIANIDMPTASTEYSYLLPPGTKQFRIRLRGVGKLQFSYSVSESGGAGPFFTVFPGECYEVQTVTLATGKTIYFQSNLASQVLEVESWS